MKAIIIDDEKLLRNSLKELLKIYCPEIEVIAEANSVKSGQEVLSENDVDLLFLDIRMKDGTGFDLLESLPSKGISFQLVFTTAYDEYALKALKLSAVDYLLKPIDPEDLIKAVHKVKSQLKKQRAELGLLKDNYLSKRPKISLTTTEMIRVVNLDEIIRCESENNYTTFYLIDGSSILVSKTLKEYERLLSDFGFLRCHQSHLVNIDFIRSYVKQKGSYIQLNNKSKVPVSHRKKEWVHEFLLKAGSTNSQS